MKIKVVLRKGILKDELSIFYNILSKYNIIEVDDIMEADYLFSFGGDGTILSLIKFLKKKNIPVFAVNYGNVGYMTKFTKENYIAGLIKFLENNYNIEERNFLDVYINNEKYYALNEMSILKCGINSKMIKVEAYQDENLINEYKGDGIIVCTPTGSTAYSLSANGPIITNDVKCICITPLAPQSLSARSIVVSANKKLSFKVKSSDGYVGLNLDGNFYQKLDEKVIINVNLSDFKINLIDCFNVNYFDILKQKLHWS